jgi:hypothetical protein
MPAWLRVCMRINRKRSGNREVMATLHNMLGCTAYLYLACSSTLLCVNRTRYAKG